MMNMKTDLYNELRNEKYYLESEFVRYGNDNLNFSRKERVDSLKNIFMQIANVNQAIGLVEVYMPEPAPQVQETQAPLVDEPVIDDVVSSDDIVSEGSEGSEGK